jgi:hypothetical protein
MLESKQNLPNGAAGIGSLINNPVQEQYQNNKDEEEEVDQPQLGEELADCITKTLGDKDNQWDDIDQSATDPVIKCIQGDYTGRFVYLNSCKTDEEETVGELIGGRPEYDLKLN